MIKGLAWPPCDGYCLIRPLSAATDPAGPCLCVCVCVLFVYMHELRCERKEQNGESVSESKGVVMPSDMSVSQCLFAGCESSIQEIIDW